MMKNKTTMRTYGDSKDIRITTNKISFRREREREDLHRFAFLHETDRTRRVTRSYEVESFSYERPA